MTTFPARNSPDHIWRKDDFNRATATFYTIARITDVGNQLLRQVGSVRWNGLPRTFDEYMARTYGARQPDRFLFWNYGLLAAGIALILAIAGLR